MKWYSVKDFGIPANFGRLFVAIAVDELVVFGLAEYTHNIKTDKFSWFDDNDSVLLGVTHFCIPEPIRINE